MLHLVPPSENQCFPLFTFHERLLYAKDALSVLQNNCRQPIFFLVSEDRQIFIKIEHAFKTLCVYSQPAFTCSKLTIETLEQSVKYVQS